MALKFGDLPVDDRIDTEKVLRVVKPIWREKPNDADRMLGLIRLTLDVAKVRNFRTGDNPARWEGHLAIILREKPSEVKPTTHYPYLPHAELPTFMRELRQHTCISAEALQFGILTWGRPGVVRRAMRNEINFTEREWQIPGHKMKGRGRAVRYPRGIYRVPLSEPALAIARRVLSQHDEAYLFPGQEPRTSLGPNAFYDLLQDMHYGHVTSHGLFRATSRTWSDDRTICEDAVKEMALGHSLGKKTLEAYS